MREDRSYGHSCPSSRVEVIHAAANLYCSICDSRPCYLFTTAATTVVQEQLTESEGENLVGAVRYVQGLERLQHCLNRHLEIAQEAWQLDKPFRVTERALRSLSENGADVKKQQENLQTEHNGDPPTPTNN